MSDRGCDKSLDGALNLSEKFKVAGCVVCGAVSGLFGGGVFSLLGAAVLTSGKGPDAVAIGMIGAGVVTLVSGIAMGSMGHAVGKRYVRFMQNARRQFQQSQLG